MCFWTEQKALSMIIRNGGEITNETGKQKMIIPPPGAGNKTWGAIDFLCHYCGYGVSLRRVSPLVENPRDSLSFLPFMLLTMAD